MRTVQKSFALCSLAALLAACGGSNTESPPTAGAMTLTKSGGPTAPVQPGSHAPEEYKELVQRLYLAYFGRPADVDGLVFWQRAFSDRGAPLVAGELIGAYASNGGVKQLIDNFVNSPESQRLYTGDNVAFINAVYQNAFNRNVEPDGLAFWSGFVNRGELTRGQVVLWILNGGQNEDAILIAKKVQASVNFTVALANKGDLAKRAYAGESVNQGVRDLLASITAGTDIVAFQARIDDFIETIVSTPGDLPAITRYSGFNYLQDMSNAPTYSAYYSYLMSEFGFFIGRLIFGGVPQTVTWTRSDSAGISYAAPITAGLNFNVSNVPPSATKGLPDVAMLCQAVAGSPGASGKSTDILVANSATAVLEASALANQSFTFYRENCALAGQGGATPNVQSFVFDAAGNAVIKAQNGTSTYTANMVTKALNGQVLFDVSTGKYLTFKVYRIVSPSGAVGFVIVEHLAGALTGLKDGVLGLWTQE